MMGTMLLIVSGSSGRCCGCIFIANARKRPRRDGGISVLHGLLSASLGVLLLRCRSFWDVCMFVVLLFVE